MWNSSVHSSIWFTWNSSIKISICFTLNSKGRSRISFSLNWSDNGSIWCTWNSSDMSNSCLTWYSGVRISIWFTLNWSDNGSVWFTHPQHFGTSTSKCLQQYLVHTTPRLACPQLLQHPNIQMPFAVTDSHHTSIDMPTSSAAPQHSNAFCSIWFTPHLDWHALGFCSTSIFEWQGQYLVHTSLSWKKASCCETLLWRWPFRFTTTLPRKHG